MAAINERFGKYTVQIRKKGFPSKNKTFIKKEDAEAWARKIESEMERGEWHDKAAAEEKNLADVLRDYRDGHAASLKSAAATQGRIDAILTRWPICEKVSMSNIDQGMFSDYVKRREADGVSGSTINREIGIMSAAINRAIADGLPADNPIEKINRPTENPGRDRRLHDGEMRRLLRELRPRERNAGRFGGGVDDGYVRWIVRFAIETAMRKSEILSLEWKHVHLSKRYVHLPATKNGERRDVPLTIRAARVMRVMLATREKGERLVFPIHPEALKSTWRRATERAEIEDLHFHDLRHEGCSRLAERLDMLELASVTGHKDPRMLKRYYHPKAQNLAAKLRRRPV
jgi:integrase